MSCNNQILFGIRLVQARKRNAWALRELADKLHGLVTAAALSKYENGQMLPSPEVRLALYEAFELPEDFFFRPLTSRLGAVEFRKQSCLGRKEEGSIREVTADFFERYAELEELVGETARFENPLEDFPVRNGEDVERAACHLREAWQMGMGPIPSAVNLLEEHHILVHVLEAPKGFDGCAGMAGDRQSVALNAGTPVDRRRFNALHELGHIVLKFEGVETKEREKLCHRFAGAMLLPEAKFRESFGERRQHFAISELMEIKATHGISCAAALFRAGDLGLIAAGTVQRTWMLFSTRGYRRKDPGDCPFDETPRRFKRMLSRAVAENLISRDKGAVLAGQSEEEFRAQLEIFP